MHLRRASDFVTRCIDGEDERLGNGSAMETNNANLVENAVIPG